MKIKTIEQLVSDGFNLVSIMPNIYSKSRGERGTSYILIAENELGRYRVWDKKRNMYDKETIDVLKENAKWLV